MSNLPPTNPVPEAEGGGELIALRKCAEYASDVRWRELAEGAHFTLIDRMMLADLHRLGNTALALSSEAPPVVCEGEDGSARADGAEPGSPARAAVVPAAEQAGGWRFRKRPVVIEAYQFHNRVGTDERPLWLLDAVAAGTVCFHDLRAAPGFLAVKTLEGVMRADVGDWIIQGVKGELYPCKPGIFEATYEPAPPPDHDAIPSAEGGSARSQPGGDARERCHDAQHEDGKGEP